MSHHLWIKLLVSPHMGHFIFNVLWFATIKLMIVRHCWDFFWFVYIRWFDVTRQLLIRLFLGIIILQLLHFLIVINACYIFWGIMRCMFRRPEGLARKWPLVIEGHFLIEVVFIGDIILTLHLKLIIIEFLGIICCLHIKLILNCTVLIKYLSLI